MKEGSKVPRRGNVPKREILPDPVYNSVLVTKLITGVMLDGKKGVAQKVVYDAFDLIQKKLDRNPLEVFTEDVYKRQSFTFGNLFAVKIIGAEERKVKRVFRGEESAALSETSTYRTWIKKSRYMVDAAQGTIPVTPTTVWLYKKYNICERGCQDRGRQKEIPDTYGKHAAPLARSSSVFGDFKKAESGPVQGATVNRRLVEPTNSASVDTIHSNLGIVKKILWLLYAERKRES